MYRQQELALTGERKEAMENILREFIERGWLETCPVLRRPKEGGRKVATRGRLPQPEHPNAA